MQKVFIVYLYSVVFSKHKLVFNILSNTNTHRPELSEMAFLVSARQYSKGTIQENIHPSYYNLYLSYRRHPEPVGSPPT